MKEINEQIVYETVMKVLEFHLAMYDKYETPQIKDSYDSARIHTKNIMKECQELKAKKQISKLKRILKDMSSDAVDHPEFFPFMKGFKNLEYFPEIFQSTDKKIHKWIKRGYIKSDEEFQVLDGYIGYYLGSIEDSAQDKDFVNDMNELFSDYLIKRDGTK